MVNEVYLLGNLADDPNVDAYEDDGVNRSFSTLSIIASYAPSMEAGSIMGNLFGVVLVVISPVFFSMDQAPVILRWLGWVSPMRYAADGVMKSLSGQTDVWLEFLILTGFALVTTSLGLWKMKWRDR